MDDYDRLRQDVTGLAPEDAFDMGFKLGKKSSEELNALIMLALESLGVDSFAFAKALQEVKVRIAKDKEYHG